MNYSVSEQELCATIFALKQWRHYLEGCEGLCVVTDHHPNTFFQGTPVLSRKQARWYETLQRFNFTWQYEPGHTNVADPLSRCTNLLTEVQDHCKHVLAAFTRSQARTAMPCTPDAPGPGRPVNSEVIPTTAQSSKSQDKSILTPVTVIDTVQGPSPSALDCVEPQLLTRLKEAYLSDPKFSNPGYIAHMIFHDGYWWSRGLLDSYQVVVPQGTDLRDCLIAAHHDSPSYGHPGAKRTLELLQRNFRWRGMEADVKRFVASCDSCQRNKIDPAGRKGLLQPLQVADMPWSSLSFDFITCLPPTNEGNNALLVVVDRLTKMVRLIPCDFHCTGEDVAQLLYTHVFSIFGVPDTLISDRDPRFTAASFKNWALSLGIKQCLSSAYHPQSDGQTERMNRVVEDMLRHFVNPRGSDWDTFVPAAQLAINNAYNTSIRSTPFFLNFGRHPKVPGALSCYLPGPPPLPDTLANQLKGANALLRAAQDRHTSWQTTRANIAHAQKLQQKYYNKGRRDLSFKVGDQVLFSTQNAGLKTTLCRKLLPKWIGPFAVEKIINPVAYKLTFPPHVKWHPVVHVSTLRRYVPGRASPPPLPQILDGEIYYEVADILNHSKTGSRKGKPVYKFLIAWKGYGPESNTWEPESNLNDACKSYLQEYKMKHGLLTQ
jgi:hypothetical protein